MTHISDDRLVDLALDAPANAVERDHLSGCADCTRTRVALLETIAAARSAGADLLVSPPPRVWEAIQAEIGAQGPRAIDADHARSIEGTPGEGASVSAIGDRRARQQQRLPVTWLLAAACVLGIVLGVGGSSIVSRLGGEPEPTEVTVASAPLAPLDSAQTMGVASLVDRDGGLRLDVPDLSLDPGDGFLEVWLINRDLTRMISVGVIPADATEVVLPVSQQLIDEGYVIVDISREPFDDQPAHSGQTLVRGELST